MNKQELKVELENFLKDIQQTTKSFVGAVEVKEKTKNLIIKLKKEYNEEDSKILIFEIEALTKLKTTSLFRVSKGIKDIIKRL